MSQGERCEFVRRHLPAVRDLLSCGAVDRARVADAPQRCRRRGRCAADPSPRRQGAHRLAERDERPVEHDVVHRLVDRWNRRHRPDVWPEDVERAGDPASRLSGLRDLALPRLLLGAAAQGGCEDDQGEQPRPSLVHHVPHRHLLTAQQDAKTHEPFGAVHQGRNADFINEGIKSVHDTQCSVGDMVVYSFLVEKSILRHLRSCDKMRHMPPLSEQLRPFLENLELSKGRSALTVRNYEFYLRRFIDWANDPDPKNITQDVIHRFRLHLNRLEDPHRGALKKNTQNYHLIALRAFLKYLARNDIKTLAPEKIELAKQGTREVSFLEQADLERLMHAPDGADTAPLVKLRDKAILKMLFSTGMRVSELANLKREQVSVERDELTVRGKGDKLRIVFVSDQARSALREYLDARQDTCPFLFIRHDRGRGRKNPEDVGALTPRSIERLVHQYSVIAGITKKISPHTLRHSFATDLLMNGADIRSVQSLLGHSSITTTQIYTHITNQQLKDVFNAFHGKQMDEEEKKDEPKTTPEDKQES